MRIASPASLDRQLRTDARFRCGFGCIRCGCTVFVYCVVERDGDDDWVAGDVFLLCPPCRDRLNANADAGRVLDVLRRDPLPLQSGFYRDRLPYARTNEIPDTLLASGTILRGSPFPIMFDRLPLISLVPPEIAGGPARLDVTLGARDGKPVPLVKANEWIESAGWRFDRQNSRYLFASLDGAATLELTFQPGLTMRIDRLDSCSGNRRLEVDILGCRVDGQPVVVRNSVAQMIGVRF